MTEEILAQLNENNYHEIIESIKNIQDDYFLLNGKYCYINNGNYISNEYAFPDNKFGYDIVFTQFINEKIYRKSIAYGFDSINLTKDWEELVIINKEV